MRLAAEAPVTKLERDTLTEVVGNFVEPAKALGVTITVNETELSGPALLSRAIAIHQ